MVFSGGQLERRPADAAIDKALLLSTSISLHSVPASVFKGGEPDTSLNEPENSGFPFLELAVSSAWSAKSKCCHDLKELLQMVTDCYSLLISGKQSTVHPPTAYSSSCRSLVWSKACTLLSHKNCLLGTARQIFVRIISSSL